MKRAIKPTSHTQGEEEEKPQQLGPGVIFGHQLLCTSRWRAKKGRECVHYYSASSSSVFVFNSPYPFQTPFSLWMEEFSPCAATKRYRHAPHLPPQKNHVGAVDGSHQHSRHCPHPTGGGRRLSVTVRDDIFLLSHRIAGSDPLPPPFFSRYLLITSLEWLSFLQSVVQCPCVAVFSVQEGRRRQVFAGLLKQQVSNCWSSGSNHVFFAGEIAVFWLGFLGNSFFSGE